MVDTTAAATAAPKPAESAAGEDVAHQEGSSQRPGLLRRLHITVEPVLFAYIFAYMLTSVVEEAFFMDRACRVHLSLPDRVCDNIQSPAFKAEAAKAQVKVSNFLQYTNIVSSAVPTVLALFLGAWSDRRGRKLPLLMGLTGITFSYTMHALVAMEGEWPLETLLALAYFPSALTGSGIAVFFSTHSYLTDVTSIADRSLRLSILDGVYLIAMPTAIALGSALFASVNRSFVIMYLINSVVLLSTVVYSYLVLQWRTTATQKSFKGVNVCTDFFDRRHIVESAKVIGKSRPKFGRLHLILIILATGVFSFQRNERQIAYLYTQMKFNWTVDEFSNFRTAEASFFVISSLFGPIILTKWLKLRDTTIILLAVPLHMSATVVYATAQVPWLYYVGAALSSLGPTVAPMLRSMTSKIVTIEERGKAFVILTVADTLFPMASSAVYSQVYNATLLSYPPAFYWVTFSSQVLLLSITMFISLSMARQDRFTDGPERARGARDVTERPHD